VDFQIMREMGWNYAELQATPRDIRTYAWDYIVRERSTANAKAERAARAQSRAPGTTAIEY
jgi:hypothetical protein